SLLCVISSSDHLSRFQFKWISPTFIFNYLINWISCCDWKKIISPTLSRTRDPWVVKTSPLHLLAIQ
ncbi:hypothetical protein M8J76_000095, partial [Diaphorina citri]